jgi:hypothetical protein
MMLRQNMSNPNIPISAKLKAGIVMLIGGTVLGAISLQAVQVLRGRDFLPMTDSDGNPDLRFLTAALMKSGALGWLGDMVAELSGLGNALQPNQRMYPRNTWDIIADNAPALGLMNRIVFDLFGNAFGDALDHLEDGDNERAFQSIGGGLIRTSRELSAVFGTKLWFTETLFNRLFFDNLEQMIDPEGFEDRVDRQKEYLDQFGQDFFWNPGEMLPGDLPQTGVQQDRDLLKNLSRDLF